MLEFVFVTLFDFRTPFLFLLVGEGASVSAPVRSFLEPFSLLFRKNDVLPAWELISQPELSSHASKTAIFDLRKQGFHLPVFFMFCQSLLFVVVF